MHFDAYSRNMSTLSFVYARKEYNKLIRDQVRSKCNLPDSVVFNYLFISSIYADRFQLSVPGISLARIVKCYYNKTPSPSGDRLRNLHSFPSSEGQLDNLDINRYK